MGGSRITGVLARRLSMPRSAVLLLAVVLSGCSASTRSVVRLDTGQGEPLVHTPRRDVEPALGVPERSGWFWYEGRSRRLMVDCMAGGVSVWLPLRETRTA
jgi:hypothetical protein